MILASTFRRPDNLTEKQAYGSSRCMLTQVHLTKVRYRLWLEFQGVFLWDFKIKNQFNEDPKMDDCFSVFDSWVLVKSSKFMLWVRLIWNSNSKWNLRVEHV